MSKFKSVALALATAGLLSAHVHAGDGPSQNLVPTSAAAVFNQAEVQGMFEQGSTPLQLTALSQREMKETEGAFGFGGAALGFGFYGAQTAFSSWNLNHSFSTNLRNTANNWSWRNAGLSAASGFVSGGFSNTMLRGLGHTTFRSQWTAPVTTQAVIRGNGFALGQTSFGLHRR